jgi:deazaflavin-dependent oxidoreductase (nitroreductase family)
LIAERLQRNQLVIDEFRSAGGVVGGDFQGVPLLLLTTTGARSGEPRTMPMTYLRDGAARLMVFAANGGRESHPGWYHNLLADPSARVEVGDDVYDVEAAETDGAERERFWAEQLVHAPYFAAFQERAGRRIPVVALTRVDT